MLPSLAILPASVVIAALLCFFAYYISALQPRKGTLEWIERAARPRQAPGFSVPVYPMGRKDVLPVLVLTLVYAATAFFRLGDPAAPQSFLSVERNATAEFSLDREVTLAGIGWYTGLGAGEYTLEVSGDSVHWVTLCEGTDGNGAPYWYWQAQPDGGAYTFRQGFSDLFKWDRAFVQGGETVSARYFRLTGSPDDVPLQLGELVLYDREGEVICADVFCPAGEVSARALFNEQELVPGAPHWSNSAYFDEIYHVRAAQEMRSGLLPFEQSHPPLGKLIIAAGIELFGLTAFGWRFMGTLFGTAMVPLMYVFLKNLFGKTAVAFCAAAVFAFDFMHLTQTRIATIDTYTVFFVLAMYYFLYRCLALPAGTPFRRCAPWLLLSGLMFALGTACKWPVLYGGAGMAVLYFVSMYFKCRQWPTERRCPGRGGWVCKMLLFSVLSFVLIPAVIYALSYFPYAAAAGGADSLGAAMKEICLWPFVQLPGIIAGQRELFAAGSRDIVDIMLNNQHFMFTYHVDVTASHPYESRWYQWLADARPILYYMDNSVPGYTARFAAFLNPVVCWGGLAAVAATGVHLVRRRCGKALLILVGYLAQLLPWIVIGRTTFAYHYFPCVIFLCLAMGYVFNELARSGRSWKGAVYSLTAGTAGLYALFYPVLIGLQVPVRYMETLIRWFSSWPF